MKTKTNKKNFSKKQDILCQVVDVFMKNGIHKNEDIISVCRDLNSDKLRGVKRSLTLNKRKSSKSVANIKNSAPKEKRVYFIPKQSAEGIPSFQQKPLQEKADPSARFIEDMIKQYMAIDFINQLKSKMRV